MLAEGFSDSIADLESLGRLTQLHRLVLQDVFDTLRLLRRRQVILS